MLKLWINSLVIILKIRINKLKTIINFNKKILTILYVFYFILKELLFKTSYALLFVIIYFLFDKLVSLNMYIILTIIGAIINSNIFSSNESKKIMLGYFKSKSSYIIINFYQELLLNIIFLSPGLLLYSYLIDECFLAIILFIISTKSFFNMIMLLIYEKKQYLYNDDDINKVMKTLLIIMFMIFFITFETKIDISIIICIINWTIFISTWYIFKYHNYSSLIANNNYYLKDYYLKENFKLTYQESNDYDIAETYLNHIFVKRHLKYYLIYIIRGIVINLVLLLLIDISSQDDAAMAILIITYFSNCNRKFIDLYYYKCDKYLKNNMSKDILYKKRLYDLFFIGLITNIPLIIYTIRNLNFEAYIFIFIMNLLYAYIALNMLFIFKIYNQHTNTKYKKYYFYKGIILLIIFCLDNYSINRYLLYTLNILFLVFHIVIVKSILCKNDLKSIINVVKLK